MNEDLKKYKELLDLGSFEGLRYIDEEKSRYKSFDYCLDFLKNIEVPEVLELGTCRSFVDGKFRGCNSDDSIYWESLNFSKWDWGAGCFSLVFGQLSKCNLTTLDLSEAHIRRCKIMTDSLDIECNHIVSNSLDFLDSTDNKFDLIYLDTGDMWPIEPTCDLQLKEVQIIINRELLKKDGLLLIDDVLNKTPKEMGDQENKLGKSEYSIPYLIENGYEVVFKGYQYILRKK
jgi:hypothetical protein